MTVRTTTLKGADAGAYYVEKELGYYLDRGEPRGRWQGRGAARLNLGDTVDEEQFLALMAGEDPATGRLLGTKHTEKTDRGFDVTCSAPKSVSVLFALGDPATRKEVLEAEDAAVTAMLGWVERNAHCRYRVNGPARTFDAEGIVVGKFRHHTSRALDPQLHTHAVVVNRVASPDGRWLALDARTIKKDQQTLSRLYHATLRSELTLRLGVRWETPVNGIAEIADIPADVRREFSRRTEDIERRIDEKIDRFTDSHDRQPTLRERWKLEREAVIETRPHKDEPDPATLEAEWRDRLTELGLTPTELVEGAVGRTKGVARIGVDIRDRIADRAVAALTEKQSTWRAAEITREVAAAVPTAVAMPAESLSAWVDLVTEDIIQTRMLDLSWPAPDGVPQRRDGRPITESAVDRVLTTPEILAQEERILMLAERRLGAGGADRQIKALDDTLTPAQVQLASAVAGERDLVLAVGPAGTGKTTALRPSVDQLRREGRPVFGVAPSAGAAEVLAVDTGADADTLDKLLIEHRLDRPPDHRYDLPAGSTIVVDEAAMVSTPLLAELFELAETRQWRLVLVGDPMQFSAVGRSGMFGHLVDSFDAIELDRVHRFNHDWEARASLRLRRGDTTVVEEYDEMGRLHGGTATRMREAAVDAWWTSIEIGKKASLMAPTNATVVELNRMAQRRRVEAGHLDPASDALTVGAYRLHIGDTVATRHNDRRIRTNRHLMVKNRARWTIDAIHRDGSLTVTGRRGQVRLPAEYVAENVELAYAQTSHASQGRTVDHSFLVLDGPANAAGIYVPMTRGRETNEAFVTLRGEETPADVVSDALSRTWIDRPAVAALEELQRAPESLPRQDEPARPMPARELRRCLERVGEVNCVLERIDIERRQEARERSTAFRRTQTAEDRLRRLRLQLNGAHRAVAEFDRPRRRRRDRDELERAQKLVECLPAEIETMQRAIADLTEAARPPDADGPTLRLRRGREAELCDELADLKRNLTADAVVRATVDGLDDVVARHVGPMPADPSARAQWAEAAGRLAQHRLAFNVTGANLLGDKSRRFDDYAYTGSRHAAEEALKRLDRVLGRQPTIEPPRLSRGLSL